MTFLAIDVGNTRLKWRCTTRPPRRAIAGTWGRIFEHIERLAEIQRAQLPTPTRVLGRVVAGDAVKRRVREPN